MGIAGSDDESPSPPELKHSSQVLLMKSPWNNWKYRMPTSMSARAERGSVPFKNGGARREMISENVGTDEKRRVKISSPLLTD